MANVNTQRVAAFLLASLFLLSTIGTTAYVIWQINQDDTGIVDVSTQEQTRQATQQVAESTSTISNFTGAVEVPELRFEDEVVGDGAVVEEGAVVTIHYTGALASDGSIFDSSVGGEPAEFPLDNLIQGWQEGIPGMKVGGKRRLFIPSAQGYGATGSNGIPADADLIFDIELFATE